MAATFNSTINDKNNQVNNEELNRDLNSKNATMLKNIRNFFSKKICFTSDIFIPYDKSLAIV